MRNISKKKLILLGIVSIIVIFIGYKLLSKNSESIILNGNVEIQDVNVSFRVTGRISEILVDEGNDIKKGDILAILDKDTFEAKLKYAKALKEEAKVSLKNAEKNYRRNKDLFRKKSISEKLYDASWTEYEVAIAKMDSSAAAVELMNIDLQDTILKSPVDGIVLTKNIEPGEMINSGVTAFSIMPHTQTKIKTFASENILSKIKFGDIVYVNIETSPNKKFKGHIGFISTEAEFTPKNIETKELRTSLMYRIRVIIDEPASELKQGMPVTVSYNK
jgi:HlyD family secretion protein